MSRRLVRLSVTVSILFVLLLSAPVGTQDAGFELSPGVIGLIALDEATVANEALLVQALTNTQPAVRAAAARVAFAQGRRGLLDHVFSALQKETDGDAAVEQARFLATFGSPDMDRTLLGVPSRLPSVGHRVALFVARARGPAAFGHVGLFRAIHPDRHSLAMFIRVASRGEQAPVEALLLSAQRDGDVQLVASILAAARLDKVAFTDEAVGRLLGDESPETVRVAAIAHLVLTTAPTSTISDQLRTITAKALQSAADNNNPVTEFIVELGRRHSGVPARTDVEWLSTLRQRASAVQSGLLDLWADRLTERLSVSEYAAFTRALYGQARKLPVQPKGVSRDEVGSPALVRLLSGHPRGFTASILQTTKCRVAQQRNRGSGGRASYRPDGRVVRMSLPLPPSSRECDRAVEALLRTYVVEPDRAIRQDEEDVLVFPFQSDFVACQDAVPAEPVQRWLFDDGTVKPPKRTRNPSPVYPATALNDKVSGTVFLDAIVGTTGCVAGGAVTRGVDARLDWEALRTVSAWKFTPTILNGMPVAIAIRAEIDFKR